MADGNTSRKQQLAADINKSAAQNERAASSSDASVKKGERAAGKSNNRPRVGGTAVQGAKSTLPKQTPATNDPNEQQLASYNRTMRRRVEKMGSSSTDQRMQNLSDQRRKRNERRKQRMEAQRAEIRKSMPGVGRITLGRRNTLFIIGVVALLVIIIVAFIILHSLHMIG